MILAIIADHYLIFGMLFMQLRDNFKIINLWVERNLTQETVDGSLSKAFEVDGIIDQLTECILAGRNPIIIGESGIGKTSIIHELVRRIESGSTLGELKGQHD